MHSRSATSPLAVAFVLACGGCCGSDDDVRPAQLTFDNATPFFLHLLHPEGNHLFVAPGEELSFEVESSEEITILIAPGQDEQALVVEHASCCFTEEFSDCAHITARFADEELFTDVREPSCPGGGGSCPYVYAGADDRLQGESLVGALNRGAARGDTIVLPELRADAGRYRVRLSAELDETDFIDAARLELVEHPRGTRVLEGSRGGLFVVGAGQGPVRARTAAGSDRSAALRDSDGAFWEGRTRNRSLGGRVRDWVDLSFERPAGATRATLILRGRNTRFLQSAYHDYMRSFGPGLPKLMRAFTRLPGYGALLDGFLRDSGFSLEVAVRERGAFVAAPAALPIGPAGARTVALPIALPDDVGPTLQVRLAMLPGAWIVDSARISFDARDAPAGRMLSPTAAELRPTRRAADASPSAQPLATVTRTDQRHVRIETGHSLELYFDAPATHRGVERTAVLHLRGYYEENDVSPAPCVNWRALARASFGDSSFARHALSRLAFLDVVDRYAAEAGVTRPR